MTMYGYQVDPIDFWEGWITEAAYIETLMQRHTGRGAFRDIAELDKMRDDLWKYDQFRKDAFHVAELVNWDGDISSGPYLCVLPAADNLTLKLVMGIKESNNGTTYIVSPVRLEYLEKESHIYSVGKRVVYK